MNKGTCRTNRPIIITEGTDATRMRNVSLSEALVAAKLGVHTRSEDWSKGLTLGDRSEDRGAIFYKDGVPEDKDSLQNLVSLIATIPDNNWSVLNE